MLCWGSRVWLAAKQSLVYWSTLLTSAYCPGIKHGNGKKKYISWWIPSLNQFSSQKSQLAMFDYQSHPLAILENINPLWNARLGRQTKGPKNTYAPWIPHGSSHWIFGRWSHWWLHSFKQKYGRGFKPVTPQLDTIVTGWWFQPTPLKNMKVSWDDYFQIFPIYGKIQNVWNHQPGKVGLVWTHQLRDSCSATTVPAILEFWSCHHPLWGCPK